LAYYGDQNRGFKVWFLMKPVIMQESSHPAEDNHSDE